MPWIETDKIQRGGASEMQDLQVYNGLDCCCTFEIWESQYKDMETVEHSLNAKLIYGFERAMQAPSFTMSRRGVLVDTYWRDVTREEFQQEYYFHDARFQKLAEAVWDLPFNEKGKPQNIYSKGHPLSGKAYSLNHNSPKQLQQFFYTSLQIDPIYVYDKGEAKITVNREALESLMERPWAGPFARFVVKLRDLGKKLAVLSKELSPDGRMRCSYNVAGTETGRWSASEDPFGDGDNLQNWTKRMRRCLCADPGKKLYSVDLSQAESFVTGGCSYRDGRDRAYLDACRSGDLHTSVTMEIWPDMGWRADDVPFNKELAEQPFYYALSYRDTSKRLGHGTNYFGSAAELARRIKLDKDSVTTFQLKYFRRFRGIKSYHMMQSNRIQMDFYVVTALGRLRHFFGRPDDSSTLKKAIAFEPQSTVGDTLNYGLWRVWWELDAWGPNRGPVELLLQVHDNIVFQLDDDPSDPENDQRQAEIVYKILDLLRIPLTYRDETVVIPADVETGWNWAPVKVDKANVDGLVGWKGPGSDKRVRQQKPPVTRLDRRLPIADSRCELNSAL
jgi:DNA polymerase I-like protein with 3'-5' exonuclease and polymerase domains